MLHKLVVVYNPNSSHHVAIEREVLAPARKLSGWLVGKYEVGMLDVGGNADKLAKIIDDGDLVIAAGGDGTATLAANAVVRAGKDVTLGVLGYGNFNDFARMLRTKHAVPYGDEYVGGVTEIVEKFTRGEVTEIYPLEVLVDGEHWRYAPCYVTVGMFAASTAVFDQPKVREKLKSGKKSMRFSLWQLVKWYVRERKQEFLPKGELMPVEMSAEVPAAESVEPIEEPAEASEANEENNDREEMEPPKEEVPSEVELLTGGSREDEPKLLPEKTDDAREENQLAGTTRQRGKKLIEAGVRVRAKMAVTGGQMRAGLLNARIKAQERTDELRTKWRQKTAEMRQQRAEEREWMEQRGPEIIIDGAETVKPKEAVSEEKETPEIMECAVEVGRPWPVGTTDYIAVNSERMAHLMRGRKYYLKSNQFSSTTAKLGGWWGLMWFMLRSMIWRVPGKKTHGDLLKFAEPSEVMIQAEGEYQKLLGVKEIEVRKSVKGLKVVRF